MQRVAFILKQYFESIPGLVSNEKNEVVGQLHYHRQGKCIKTERSCIKSFFAGKTESREENRN